MKKIIIVLMLFNLSLVSSFAAVINEVMSNEPGSNTALEWIELYNNQITSIPLGDSIIYKGGTIILPATVTLKPGEYYIICRRLFEVNNSAGFETVWGDSSGVWGDTPFETALQQPYVASFSLTNDNNFVILYENGSVVSGIVWSTVGLDGYSWERFTPTSLTIEQSIMPGGSPGLINTITPVPFDLSLDSVDRYSTNGLTELTFYISNAGINDISGAVLNIIENNQSIDIVEIGPVISGQSIALITEYAFNGMYVNLTGEISQDNRNFNNRLDFTAPGSEFPPLMITELMANPSDILNSEWVELKNISDVPFDVLNWQLGDSLSLKNITDTSILIDPGEYFIIAENKNNFDDFYFTFSGLIIEPTQWPIFNNSSDLVRLVDQFGIEADRFSYDDTFGDGSTWSKSEDPDYLNRWGKSKTVNGSPGEINQVLFEPQGEELLISINPTHFSPDDDGFEDETTISINFPQADNFTVKIFDRYGRLVKTFYDQTPTINDSVELVWDGRATDGRRLPIGIYILYVEADGVVSQKETLVIAR